MSKQTTTTTYWENKDLYEAIAQCFICASEMNPQPRWPEMHLRQLSVNGDWEMRFDIAFVELSDRMIRE